MRYYYLQRWLASKPKLQGKTVRESPSELTWELVIVNGEVTWYRLSGDLFKQDVVGNVVNVDRKAAKDFLDSLEPGKTLSIKPGQFLNDTKQTYVFARLAKKGRCKVEDGPVKRYVLGKRRVTFAPRTGVEGQFRVREVDTFMLKEPKLQIIPEEGGDTVSLKNVPIAKAGVWNGIQITKKILDVLKTQFEKLRDKLFVPLKIEHSGVKESEEQTHQGPALGWLARIFLVGDALYGDFIKVPQAVARLIKNGQYIGVSPEIARNFDGTPDVLVGVALLGAALPAMTTLPKLMTLYADKKMETYKPPIPFTAFGGEMSEEKVDGDVLYAARILFQRKTSPDEFADVKGALKLKKYPVALAEEMIELLPDPTVEKVGVIPEYSMEMVAQRVEILADRAKQPEKAEKVIEEIEETLTLFKDELGEADQATLKAKLEEVLASAKEHKGTTELEEAVEKEKPAEPKLLTGPTEEKYPKAPENVTVDLQKMQRELRSRALGLVEATVDKFASNGWDGARCRTLHELLVQLDPALTEKTEVGTVRNLVFQLIGALPQTIQTFESVTNHPESEDTDLIELLTKSTKRSRSKC